ncbi:MAG TPA: hypothetical protein DHU69_03985 [Deltaproteobacteria bacterium]|nr:MAG: hypothetical protein A2056_01170 [Deltaproteobacteria bacterium GWA2_42_85]OGQ76227.1 MAG: hypothetical protein A2235_11970 [Deltaproteobacteria bacterium RIFOXYA2_FULL_42_10]HCY18918.1 hypothetical protein [Deltaproteobacteria bacterium]
MPKERKRNIKAKASAAARGKKSFYRPTNELDSNKGGSNKREENRSYCLAYCKVCGEKPSEIRPLTAAIQDISKNGVNIRYIGKPLPIGSLVSMSVLNLNIKKSAKVIWSNSIDNTYALAGLEFDEPISLPIAIAI